MTITRAKIAVPAASWAFVPGTRIAVIRLAQFSAGAGKEIQVDAKLEEAPGKGGAIATTILAAAFLGGGVVLNRYEEGLAPDDDLKDPMKGLWIGCFAGAGLFAGLSIFLFAYDPSDDSSARILPAASSEGITACMPRYTLC